MSEAIPVEKKLLLSINEACALSGLKRTMLYKLIASGQIRSKPIGRRRMIPRAELERFCLLKK